MKNVHQSQSNNMSLKIVCKRSFTMTVNCFNPDGWFPTENPGPVSSSSIWGYACWNSLKLCRVVVYSIVIITNVKSDFLVRHSFKNNFNNYRKGFIKYFEDNCLWQ